MKKVHFIHFLLLLHDVVCCRDFFVDIYDLSLGKRYEVERSSSTCSRESIKIRHTL